MSERTIKIIFYAFVCPLFFGLALTCGAYWTFPYDHLREFIVQEAERGGSMQLEIESLEPSWVTGIDLEGVRFASTPETPGQQPSELVVSEASARVSLLSLLTGSTAVTFDAAFDGGGTLDGEYAAGDDSTALSAELDNVDLRRIGPLSDAVGLPIAGRASGTVEVVAAPQAVDNVCNANLTVRGVSLADGETPFVIPGMGTGLTLERMNLGTLQVQMETERGACKIQRLRADGEHAELQGSGTIRPAHPLRMSSMDLLLRVKFKDAYRQSSSRMGALFTLLDMNPQVRPARAPDGALQWRLHGSMAGRVRMEPAGRTQMPGATR
jgi:type II secretion system protein N